MDEWRVLGADSEYDWNNRKENLLSSDRKLWLTGKDAPYPHWIAVDTGKKQQIRGLIVTPPKTAECDMGPVFRYRILVGDTPETIETPVAEGTFDNIRNNPLPQIVNFPSPVSARCFRFEALESANGSCYAGLTRIELF